MVSKDDTVKLAVKVGNSERVKLGITRITCVIITGIIRSCPERR